MMGGVHKGGTVKTLMVGGGGGASRTGSACKDPLPVEDVEWYRDDSRLCLFWSIPMLFCDRKGGLPSVSAFVASLPLLWGVVTLYTSGVPMLVLC